MAKISWLHFAAQLLQIPQTYRIEVNLVQAMDFQSLELFSVACLELYLVRNFETQKPRPETFNKLWSNFPDGRRFTHHTFMKFVITWSLFLIREWSQRCMQRPKEKPFQQTSWIKNIIEKKHTTRTCTSWQWYTFLFIQNVNTNTPATLLLSRTRNSLQNEYVKFYVLGRYIRV